MTYKKPDHLEHELRQFTNEQIADLLRKSPNWRRLKKSEWMTWYTLMRDGLWEPGNGTHLIMDKRGLLIDGQNRLAAAQRWQQENGELMWFWVVKNVDRDAADTTVDVGRDRRFYQYLESRQTKHAKHVGPIAVASTIMANTPDAETVEPICKGRRLQLGAVIRHYEANQGPIAEWAEVGEKLKKSALPRPALLASVGYFLAREHATDTRKFFKLLTSGAGLAEKDPVLTLRTVLLRDAKGVQRLRRDEVAAFTIKAWLAWRAGQNLPNLRWTGVGPKAEPFPSHTVKP